MKIVQVTPGILPIPPNGWGAVEKIIWEYKQNLEKLGYQTDILYCDDVIYDENTIVHVHMANLANILHDRRIPYVFSLHDHHVEFYGKDSEVYKENLRAIQNSKLTFIHSPHLIDFFGNLPNIVYLPHGVNLYDYKFKNRIGEEHRMLMLANNGIGGSMIRDRKGFLIGIEVAKRLNLPIDIICPESNKEFFDHHKPEYEKMRIFYGLDYKEAIEKMDEYTIFLNPSELEAGHPNLSITEAISMGIPVVSTCKVEMCGSISSNLNPEDFTKSVKKIIDGYPSFVLDIEKKRDLLSWEVIVNKMIQHYKKYLNVSQKSQLLHNYLNFNQKNIKKEEKNGFIVNFKSGNAFCKTSIFSDGLTVLFKDKKTNRLIFWNKVDTSPGNWSMALSNDIFTDWRVEIKSGNKLLYYEDLDLKDKHILLNINKKIESSIIKEFAIKTGCVPIIKSDFDYSNSGFFIDKSANPDNFYTSYDENQILDYFSQKNKLVDKKLILVGSNSLGDTLVATAYTDEWCRKTNTKVDFMCNFHDIVDKEYYSMMNIIPKSDDMSKYTDITVLEYVFSKPLQRGYSDQFELDYKEIRPRLKNTEKERPIKSKYVCLGVQTTSQAKYWNYPNGWEILSKCLRKSNITPVSLDKYEIFGVEGSWNYLPNSSVKKVGLDFEDVINYINNSEFFIGVSSGLSWIAYSLGKKVVLISGVTTEDNEFTENCIRIINKSVCNSCFNNTGKYKFNGGDWNWCPVNKNTEREFECSKSISPELVIQEIEKNKLV
jgi:autotransporter strand-loop-strand O-heptosyltransferase